MEESILGSLLNDELKRSLDMVDVDTIENLEIRLERLFGYLHYIQDHRIAPSVVTDEILETFRMLLKSISAISDSVHDQKKISL